MILAGGGGEFSPVLCAQQCGVGPAQPEPGCVLHCSANPTLLQQKAPEAEMH